MADLDDLYRWLQGATFRHTSLDQRKMVERLIAEGRAEWVNPWNRARAIPNPVGKPKRDYKTENAKLRAALEWFADEGHYELTYRHGAGFVDAVGLTHARAALLGMDPNDADAVGRARASRLAGDSPKERD